MTSHPRTLANKRGYARRFGAIAVLLLTMLTVGGCLKVDYSIKVHKNDTFSGNALTGVDKRVISSLGVTPKSVGNQMYDSAKKDDQSGTFPGLKKGKRGTLRVERFEDSNFIGVKFYFSGIPLSEFSSTDSASKNEALQISHRGGKYHLRGGVDLRQSSLTGSEGSLGLGTDPSAGAPNTPYGSAPSPSPSSSGSTDAETPELPNELLSTVEVSFSVSFPGLITFSNGVVDGKSAHWNLRVGKTYTLSADAKDSLSIVDWVKLEWLWVTIGFISAVFVIGAIFLIVYSTRRHLSSIASWRPDSDFPPAPMAPSARARGQSSSQYPHSTVEGEPPLVVEEGGSGSGSEGKGEDTPGPSAPPESQ